MNILKIICVVLFSFMGTIGFAQDCDEDDCPAPMGCPCQGAECKPPPPPIKIPVIHGYDPNIIIGPDGYDTIRWISATETLPYKILFENDPDFATGPAQTVLVYQPLDEHVDPSTFRLGSFGFGNYVFTVPPNTSVYSERLDVIDGLGIYVDILAGVDFNERQAFWIFKSIDPATGLAPEDAFTGFLPVNDTLINFYNDTVPKPGEGFMNYTIRSANDVETGDTISAQAGIVFDLNAPVITNTWTNVIDAFPPTSMIEQLAENTDSLTAILNFIAEDDPGGVGIRDFELYVSKDGGSYYLHEAGITTMSYAFSGEGGSEYCFFTLATDHVGNKEAMKTAPATCTTLEGRYSFDIKVLLQGAYDTLGLMSTQLNERGILPGQTPTSLLVTPTSPGQPYNRPPWNYTGTEGIDWTDADYYPDVVDWVLVSFRTDSTKSTEIGITAALLYEDGRIEIPADFSMSSEETSMFIVIEHRGHMGIMTPERVSISDNTLSYDFRLADSYTDGTGYGQKQLTSGNWAMYAGDADQMDTPSYDITGADKIIWQSENGVFDYYLSPDFDMSGSVDGNDKILWDNNNGISSRVPK